MNVTKIAQPTPENLAKAAGFLRRGDLVGVPTETVYGLAADATNSAAVAKIYTAKKRPPNNPLIIHAASASAARQWIDVDAVDWLSQQFEQAAQFWPGPLTVVAPRSPRIADAATAGGDSVGVRVPNHPVALALLELCEFPLAAPSANPSNYISPTTALHVASGLGDQLSMILDGGPCACGVESTIIKLDQSGPQLLRAGGLPVAELELAFGHPIATNTIHFDSDSMIASPAMQSAAMQSAAMQSPGQFKKHYSPIKPLLIQGIDPVPSSTCEIGRIAMAPISDAEASAYKHVWTLSEDGNLDQVAHNLFAVLREADQSDVQAILIDACEATGIGQAIMDRITRAAAP
jgi:L-threonylcarbamoyladenylate synthase